MILPKQIDINKAKAAERKLQIDEGVALAQRVDELRGMRLQMEKNFEVWRVETSRAIQEKIDRLIEYKEFLEQDTKALGIKRQEMIKPLDEEWGKLNQAKEQFKKDKNELFLDQERLAMKSSNLEIAEEKLAKSIEAAKAIEKETETLNIEANELKEMAIQEHDIACSERAVYAKRIEERLGKLKADRERYKVALKTIEIREKQVDDKESDLLEREETLARRIKNLQRAEPK